MSPTTRHRSFVRGTPLVLLLASLVLAAPRAAEADAPVAGWTKIDDADGIAIYRREMPGSDVIAFKGEGLVRAPLVRVASVIFDTSRATEWIDSLAEARVVRRVGETEYVEYDHFTTPFVMKDRDFVTLNQLSYDPARQAITIRMRSTTDPAAPPTGYVRGELVSSTFVLTPTADGKATLVSGDVHCDPRGSVAKWIVNYFQKDWPRSTLKSLRAQVAKPNIVESAAVRRLVEQAAAPAAPLAH
jgi:hypothetical protein